MHEGSVFLIASCTFGNPTPSKSTCCEYRWTYHNTARANTSEWGKRDRYRSKVTCSVEKEVFSWVEDSISAVVRTVDSALHVSRVVVPTSCIRKKKKRIEVAHHS